MMGAGGEPATSGVEQHVYDLCRPQSLINPRRAWSWEKLATTLCDADAGTGPGVHGEWSRGHLVAGLPHGGDDHRAAAVREPVRQPGERAPGDPWRAGRRGLAHRRRRAELRRVAQEEGRRRPPLLRRHRPAAHGADSTSTRPPSNRLSWLRVILQ
jgi:hypothetical protein